MQRTPHQTKLFSLLMALVLFGSLFAHPLSVAAAGDFIQLAPAINEASTVGVNQPTNTVFYDKTFTVTYDGGTVCLSSKSDACSPAGTDDAVRIYVNSSQVYYQKSYTHSYGPVDFSNFLNVGQNTVRIQLIDLMGPARGGSPLYLVFGQSGEETPTVSVEVTPGTRLISPDGKGGTVGIEGQKMANVPFTVLVLLDGKPAVGADVRLVQPFSAWMGKTNGLGMLDLPPSLAIPLPPQTGDYNIVVEADYNDITGSSGPVKLYTSSLRDSKTHTFTKDEAFWYFGNMWGNFMAQPGLGAPDLPKIRGSGSLIDLLLNFVKSVAYSVYYYPKGGDQFVRETYLYDLPSGTDAYVYLEKVIRDGSTLDNRYYYYFTEDESKVFPLPDPDRKGIKVTLASPATLYITDPNGKTAGIDPVNGEQVFNFRIGLSNIGDEPFNAIIPGPIKGTYNVEVDGTGTGIYHFSVDALDSNGVSTGVITTEGLTKPGYVTRFLVDYDPAQIQPVTLNVVGSVDIKPDTLNLRSQSDKNAVTAYIELPLGFDVRHISSTTVWLDGKVKAQMLPTSIGDYDADGIQDVMVKFDRAEVIKYLLGRTGTANTATITISGTYQGAVKFTSTDEIRLLR